MSVDLPLGTRLMMEQSNLSGQVKGVKDSMMSKDFSIPNAHLILNQEGGKEEKLSMHEYLQPSKEMILNDKSSTSEEDIPLTSLLQTLDQVLTTRGKVLKPFWTTQSEENSKNWWLPTKTGSQDLDSNYWSTLFPHTVKEKSWFSTTVKVHHKKKWSMTSSQSLQSSLQGFLVLGNTKRLSKKRKICYQRRRKRQKKTGIKHLKKKGKKVKILQEAKKKKKMEKKEKKELLIMKKTMTPEERKELNTKLRLKRKSEKKGKIIKALKVKLEPTSSQKILLNKLFGQFRWWYNKAVCFMEREKIYGFFEVQRGLRTLEEKYFPKPEWMDEKEENMCPRFIEGAINDACKAYKTSFSLLQKGLIKKFNVKFKTKKDTKQTLQLRKSCFLKGNEITTIGYIKGFCRMRENKKVPLSKIPINNDSRLSFQNGEWILFIPFESNPLSKTPTHDVVGIDSGIRTFQSCFSPSSHSVKIGEECTKRIYPLLRQRDKLLSKIDKIKNDRKERNKKWLIILEGESKIKNLKRVWERLGRKIKHLVDELHWKTISFLTSTYKKIVICDFQVKSILEGPLHKKSKRMLTVLRHFQFGERLKLKCVERTNQLHFQDESYTSKTCCKCGVIKQDLGANETFRCGSCLYVGDRDISAGRNILNKFYSL